MVGGGRAILKRTRFPVLILCVLGLTGVAVAELTVFEGDSIMVEDENMTLTWGQDYTFDADRIQVSDQVSLSMTDEPDRNISIVSDTPSQVNATLWEYTLSDISDGEELILLEVAAIDGSNVSMMFTGVPDADDGSYTVYRNDDEYQTFESGGTLTWHDDDWSTHNYSLTYYEEEEDETGDDDTGGTGTPAPDPVPEHCWDQSGTEFVRDSPASGITLIEFTTDDHVENPCLDIETVPSADLPVSVPALDDVYRYYEFTLDDLDDETVSAVSITFLVNESFAEGFDAVQVSRHNGDWAELGADLIDDTGDTWTYEVRVDGFSYYAVHGVDDDEEPDDPDDPDEPGAAQFTVDILSVNTPMAGEPLTVEVNITNTGDVFGEEPVMIDIGEIGADTVTVGLDPGEWTVETFHVETADTDAGDHTANTVSGDSQDSVPVTVREKAVEEQGIGWVPVVAGIVAVWVLLAALVIGVYRAYPRWKQSRMEQELVDLSTQAREYTAVKDEERTRTELAETLTAAEQSLESHNFEETAYYIQEIKELLGQDTEEDTNPWGQ